MNSSTRMFVSIGINFLIHAAFLAIGVLVLQYGASNQKIINSDLLQALLQSAPASIAFYINDAISQSERWALFLALESLVVSTVWLLFTNAVSPAGPTQARSRLGAWFGALILLLVGAVALAWWIFVHKNIAGNLAAHFLTPLLIVSGFAVLFAFYLGTAIGVKPAMRPSVPLADAWLR